jgi:hypothetical protein
MTWYVHGAVPIFGKINRFDQTPLNDPLPAHLKVISQIAFHADLPTLK